MFRGPFCQKGQCVIAVDLNGCYHILTIFWYLSNRSYITSVHHQHFKLFHVWKSGLSLKNGALKNHKSDKHCKNELNLVGPCAAKVIEIVQRKVQLFQSRPSLKVLDSLLWPQDLRLLMEIGNLCKSRRWNNCQ